MRNASGADFPLTVAFFLVVLGLEDYTALSLAEVQSAAVFFLVVFDVAG